MLKKIFIKTLGCQMNEYDSNRILDLTKKINYLPTNNLEEANCYILNTCHIREKSTDKVYHEIGRVKKEFRNKIKPITIIAGCVAQAEGDILLKKEKYIDAVVGPQSYHEINKIILDVENKNEKINSTNFDVIAKFDQLNVIKNSNNNVSSFLTIQEGCDKFCKFCVVPYTRGPEFSRSLKEIVSEAKQLVSNGTKEIILLGQNVNAYNYKDQKLSDLLYKLDEIKKLERIRYTTSHPKDLTDDLIEAHNRCKKLMPILHLPVQSGSSKILKAMNRNHSIEEYLLKIKKLKKKKPSIKFSSDFIIAYPGESKEDFEATISLMKKVKFINSYSFIFSPRPGTPAGNLKMIDLKIAKGRLSIFQKLANKIKKKYRDELINSTAKVLFENITKNKMGYFGRDEYFNSVIVNSNENLIGKIKKVKINQCNQNTLFGEILSDISDISQKEFAA
ncbi:tRNA (N6-isopentenyl adenosine(37)-C2)-methylthiotransferase MiaB [Pelagibacteraceae bacterium]|nr:tRNA (N6-isopentenyl adenosine(37)-C2)-methylthiotransferase MiaB [Pelagibacteraceae bacterium]